jgi:hypothetical protein
LATGANTNNIVIGDQSVMGEGSANSMIIGPEAGNLGSMTDTIGIGCQAFVEVLTLNCDKNTAIGPYVGGQAEDLTDSVMLGYSAGYRMQGARNVAAGYQAGLGLDPFLRYDNVLMGYNAGNFAGGSRDNVVMGYGAGQQLRNEIGNTLVGCDAMEQVSGDASGSDLDDLVIAALNGTGGFIADGNSIERFTVVLSGTTNGVSGGTAATGAAGFMSAVFESITGGVSTRSTFVVDATGATTANIDGQYFLISSTTTDYYVWFDIDNLSTDPGPPGLNLPALVGKTGIEVNLAAGASSFSIRFSIRNAIRNVDGFDSVFKYDSLFTGAKFTIINTAVGDVTDVGPGTAVGPSKITTLIKVRDGTGSLPEYNFIDMENVDASVLAGTYFIISSTTTDYYMWFDDGFQTDPGPGGLNLPALVGRTGLQISYTLANYNTVGGYNSMRGNTTGANLEVLSENVAIGHRSMEEANTGSNNNTCIGFESVLANTVFSNSVALGTSTNITNSTEVTVLGAGSTIASGSDRSTVIGNQSGTGVVNTDCLVLANNVTTTAANEYYIGENSVSGTATMNFRTQIVADESWIGGGSSGVVIDNNGDIIRGTDSLLTSMTTDNTATTIETYTMADNTTRQIEALVMGTRTGGVVGVTADTYSVRLDAAVKRTGAVVTVNKITEIHIQDSIQSFTITNLVNGNTLDITAGTAVGASKLTSVQTVTQGSGAARPEVSVISFESARYFGLYNGRYMTFSSPTTDYYVWWDYFGFYADPGTTVAELAGKTAIPVTIFSDNFSVLATKTAAAVTALPDFNATVPNTLLELESIGTGSATAFGPGTAALGGAGEIFSVGTMKEGGAGIKEIGVIDFTGATGAGLAGKYFLVDSSLGGSFYIWYNTGADPNPGGVGTPLATRIGIVANILVGDTDSVLASKTFTLFSTNGLLNTRFTPLIMTAGLRIENAANGDVTDINGGGGVINSFGLEYHTKTQDGTLAASAEVSIVEAAGATPAGLDGTYFFLSSPSTTYYVWYRVDGTTPDPGLSGTSLPVDIVTLPTVDSAVDIATKTAAAISAVGGAAVFTSSVQPPWVIDVVSSGTDAILQVTGSDGMDITWKAYTRNFAV